uniref:Uncharacterized protein n=2 Tax=Caenorhabditis japonica TaxID=281687 RepID=A0A8R1IUE5_CAEJA
GTVRFASINCHKGTENGPKDDCESWFYLLVDLMCSAGLPWRKLGDKNDVLRCKEECRKEKRAVLFTGIKHTAELSDVLDYIDSRQYQDRMDYIYIYKSLQKACTTAGVDIDAPYDWEKDVSTMSQKKE